MNSLEFEVFGLKLAGAGREEPGDGVKVGRIARIFSRESG
jgi:hypothetical protein